MKNKAKILLYDIEVSREIVEGYRQGWDFKVVKTLHPQKMMCYAYKWLGESKIHFVSMHDFNNEKDFVESLRELQNEADIVIAHNAARFDNKMANRFYIKYGITPPSPFKTVDTLMAARSAFKFPGNSLNALCEYLEIGQKEKITYADIETEFLFNNRNAVRLMKKYNLMDVELLEKLYLKLLPFIKNHPNIGDMNEERGMCPKCGSTKLEKRGVKYGKQTYQCKDCKGWCNDSSKKTNGRIVNG